MRKSRLVAFVLSICIISMGVGYAAWSDGIKTTTSISTGNMNIESHSAKMWAKIFYKDSNQKKWRRLKSDDNAYNVSFNIGEPDQDADVKFNMSNLFPGCKVFTGFLFKNTGLVSAKVQRIKVDVPNKEDNSELFERILVSGKFVTYDKEGNITRRIKLPGRIQLSELENVLNEKLKGIEIDSKESMGMIDEGIDEIKESLIFEFSHDENQYSNGNEAEGESLNINIGIEFIQSNLYE